MLDPAAVAASLHTRTFGRRLHVFERIPGTNQVALEWCRGDVADGTVIVANEQTAGRGRRENRWLAPAGTSLLLTVIVAPTCPIGRLPVVAGVGVRRALAPYAPVALKWPNDVVIAGRKVGGILIETNGNRACIGIGINITLDVQAVPEMPRWPRA